MRAEPNGFLVHRLNHSATTAGLEITPNQGRPNKGNDVIPVFAPPAKSSLQRVGNEGED